MAEKRPDRVWRPGGSCDESASCLRKWHWSYAQYVIFFLLPLSFMCLETKVFYFSFFFSSGSEALAVGGEVGDDPYKPPAMGHPPPSLDE